MQGQGRKHTEGTKPGVSNSPMRAQVLTTTRFQVLSVQPAMCFHPPVKTFFFLNSTPS